MQLLSSFHTIRFGFMVGIGGGVPSSSADIRLGDIVVSQPTETSGGLIQYDSGKALSGGQFKRTGMLNRPPKVLLTALATLQAHHLTEDSQSVGFISNLQAKLSPHKATKFTRPTQEDCLFQAEYKHVASDTCINCDRSEQQYLHLLVS
jgi:nucleoside phosphorylase